jgi:phosphohistidine phosphatase
MDSSAKPVIWILRHAKAAASGPEGDISRPLTGRGRRQSNSVREHLEALGHSEVDHPLLPTLVLCSPATRARETAEIVMPALSDARIQFEQILYDEDADGVVEWLKLLDPSDSRLMIVGHNPTLLELCLMLADRSDHEEIENAGLPTAALVRLDEPAASGSRPGSTWTGLEPGAARMGHRFVPKS